MTARAQAALSDSVLTAMRDVAARLIMPRYKSLADGEVRSKTHPGDLVTIADEEAEEELSSILTNLLPGSRVVGEEAASKDPSVLDHLASDDPVWIIDPVDGTANFVNRRDRFGVVIALMQDGVTTMGWILNPVSGEALVAERGEGTWLHTSEEEPHQLKIARADQTPLADMAAGLNHPDFSLAKGKFARVTRLGSAAHDYWSLADGNTQVLCYRRLKPWDHTAGALIHTEAGGYNRLLSGDAYNPRIRDQVGLLCTPTEKIWKRVSGPT